MCITKFILTIRCARGDTRINYCKWLFRFYKRFIFMHRYALCIYKNLFFFCSTTIFITLMRILCTQGSKGFFFWLYSLSLCIYSRYIYNIYSNIYAHAYACIRAPIAHSIFIICHKKFNICTWPYHAAAKQRTHIPLFFFQKIRI